MELVKKKKIYFEPFQKAGWLAEVADTQGPVQTESSCVSRTRRPGLPPAWPRGWAHVRLDSIRSDSVSRMKDPKRGQSWEMGVGAVSQEQPEKWVQGRWTEQQVYPEGDEPRTWTWDEQWRDQSHGGDKTAKPAFEIPSHAISLGVHLVWKYLLGAQCGRCGD